MSSVWRTKPKKRNRKKMPGGSSRKLHTMASRPCYHNPEVVASPVGSVRSIVSIGLQLQSSCTSSSSSLQPSLTSNDPAKLHCRRGLPIAVMNADSSPSTSAVASYHRQKVKGGMVTDHSNDLERVTLIATWNVAGVGGPSRKRRLASAVVIDEPLQNEKQNYRVLGIQSAITNLSVSALCIAIRDLSLQSETFDVQQRSILVALDTFGMLHTCPINYHSSYSDEKNHLRDMRECHFEITQRTNSNGKKARPTRGSTHESKQSDSNSPDLRMMNSLTSREESDMIMRDTPSPSQIALPSSDVSPQMNARKRKQSSIEGDSVTPYQRIYLVASNLNTSILPSKSPPIVMLLNSSMSDSSIEADKTNSPHFTGLAWSIISGLERVNVPLSCILYLSRSRCGPQIWAGISTAMKKPIDTELHKECNEGVVLMGFHDGTLRASLVATKKNMSNIHQLNAGHAKTLFQLSSREPIKSIQVLSSPLRATSTNAPILICIGALGAVVSLSSSVEKPESTVGTPKFRIHEPLQLCGGCWISISCVRYTFLGAAEDCRNSEGLTRPVGLAFIGVNDLKQTFLHQLIINDFEDDDNSDRQIEGQTVFRLPIPTRLASSVLVSPQFAIINCPRTHYTFSLASSRGSVAVMTLSLSGLTSVHQRIVRDYGGKKLLATELIGTNDKLYNRADTNYHERNIHSGRSNVQSLLQKLKSVTLEQNKDKTQQLYDSVNRRSKHALHEIREISRVAALIKRSSFHDVSSPIELKIQKIHNGVAQCSVTSYNLPLTKSSTTEWLPTVHILQSCFHNLSSSLRPVSLKKTPPICFRRNVRRDGKLIPISFGGASTSYNGFHDNGRRLKIDVSINDFIPVQVFGSMSMVYAYSAPFAMVHHAWYRSEIHAPMNHCGEFRASTPHPETNSVGRATNAISRKKGSPGCAGFLGVTLPFDLDRQSPFILDILTLFSTSNVQHCGENDTAERLVIHRYQNQSAQQSAQRDFLSPWLKERQLVWLHSAQAIDKHASAKFYCSSSLIHCKKTRREDYSPMFSDVRELCVNTGCSGTITMAITSNPILNNSENNTTPNNAGGVVQIAVGSNVMSPDESMSFLPLIRQAIIRHGLRQHCQVQASINSKDDTDLLELYYTLLSERRTAKVAEHVRRLTDELIVNIDKTPEHVCPTEVLTATTSLYEKLRTLKIAFLMS